MGEGKDSNRNLHRSDKGKEIKAWKEFYEGHDSDNYDKTVNDAGPKKERREDSV